MENPIVEKAVPPLQTVSEQTYHYFTSYLFLFAGGNSNPKRKRKDSNIFQVGEFSTGIELNHIKSMERMERKRLKMEKKMEKRRLAMDSRLEEMRQKMEERMEKFHLQLQDAYVRKNLGFTNFQQASIQSGDSEIEDNYSEELLSSPEI
jgi:hypothetical protein